MTMDNSLNLPMLTDMEKAYYDTIKQVAQGARPDDLVLQRMAFKTPDGVTPVAVISQKIIRAEDATFLGYQPLALLLGEEDVRNLVAPDGSEPEAVNPDEAEGAG